MPKIRELRFQRTIIQNPLHINPNSIELKISLSELVIPDTNQSIRVLLNKRGSGLGEEGFTEKNKDDTSYSGLKKTGIKQTERKSAHHGFLKSFVRTMDTTSAISGTLPRGNKSCKSRFQTGATCCTTRVNSPRVNCSL